MDTVHVLKIIDILYNDCISAGGDGDALWYLRDYTIDEILPLVEEYNSKLEYPFEIEITDGDIHWGQNQEWIIITPNRKTYNTAPTWMQFVLKT